jgi:putative holliday junction resolvase
LPRYLGVDYGERRIGLALSDPLGMIAQPLPTITRRRGKRPPFAEIVAIVTEREVDEIVVGLPLDEHGDESEWTAEVRAFGDKLGERAARPVHYVDERMTSARAERVIRESGLSRTKREEKERVDATAAGLILQMHLDSIARGDAAKNV